MAAYIIRKLPDTLWRKVKARAASEGITLKQLFLEFLTRYAAGAKS